MRCAFVFFKTLLRDAVEGKGRDGAVEMRDGDAPGAVGAAPAGEVVLLGRQRPAPKPKPYSNVTMMA